MIFNYIIIALRNFKRNVIYTFINIFGLALGLAGSFVLINWVWQELSYEKHFKNHEQIHRISVSFYNSDPFARGPYTLKPVLLSEVPIVEAVTNIINGKKTVVKANSNLFEEFPLLVDTSFFTIFQHEVKSGNKDLIGKKNFVAITDQLALKYFGQEDAIGEILFLDKSKEPYEVAAIIEANTLPTHLDTQMWLPLANVENQSWTSASCFVYVKLKEGADIIQLKTSLEQIRKTKVYPSFNPSISYDEWLSANYFNFFTLPLSDIHLYSKMKFELSAGGNITNVYIFLAVAIFLISIAVINFVNLTTAQSIRRAKEIGIRKVLGTARTGLIIQILTETLVISSLAMIVGIGLAEIFLILFQQFTNEILINGLFNNSLQFGIYVVFGVVIGFLAGIYPAFYLTRLNTIDILRTKFSNGNNSYLRNSLVVLQFTVSIALMVCSYLIHSQLSMLQGVDLGFNRNNVLIIENAQALKQSKEVFKQKLLQHAEVENASYNLRMPAGNAMWLYTFQTKEMQTGKTLQTFIGDDNYLQTLGYRLLSGRNFSKEIKSDSTAVILTQAAVKELNLTEPVVGTILEEDYHVIGVVENFVYQNFNQKPDPVAILYNPDGFRLAVKLKGNQTLQFLQYMQEQWQQLKIEEAISYTFLDDNFAKVVDKEITLGKTISFFTTLAIVISCMGLFGLASFLTQQRQKEIGIRKVLGASISNLVLLLNHSFSRLVFISFVPATIISSWLIGRWLMNFEYKIEIGWEVFLISGMSALILAWLTVGFLTVKAAMANPVDSLRDE